MAQPNGFILGLTGGIGSGKTAAANILGELGAGVVDADAIAHQLSVPDGPAIAPLRAAFGDAVIGADGAMDRAAMRNLVFSDPDAKARLEAIIHPLIRAESERRCREAFATGAPYVVMVVPLLVESNSYRERMSRVLVIDCPEETQVARVMARNGLSREEVLRIMATQAGRAQRLAAADDVVANDKSMEELRRAVEILHRRYLDLAGAKRAGI